MWLLYRGDCLVRFDCIYYGEQLVRSDHHHLLYILCYLFFCTEVTVAFGLFLVSNCCYGWWIKFLNKTHQAIKQLKKNEKRIKGKVDSTKIYGKHADGCWSSFFRSKHPSIPYWILEMLSITTLSIYRLWL